MGILDDDADTFFDDFAEAIEYRPFNRAARPIRAIVDRVEPDAPTDGGPRRRKQIALEIPNHPTKGIVPTEIDFNNDRIGVATFEGGPLVDYGFTAKVPYQDGGVLKVVVK